MSKSEFDAQSEVNTDPALTRGQRLFILYFTAVLIDLVVLNLFAEYWDRVSIDTFTTSLLAAALLQVLLKVTLAIEHRVADFFKARPSRAATMLRYVCAWLILFGSKFVILIALDASFGDAIHFSGRLHGMLALITVLVTMILAEEFVLKIYRWLGNYSRNTREA